MNQIKVNLVLDHNYVFEKRRVDDVYDVTGFTVNGRSFIALEHYCAQARLFNPLASCSDATVRRLLKKVEHANCNDFFFKINNKIYVSPAIAMLANENYSKIDTINGSYEKYLRSFEWDYFCCIAFEWELSQKTVKARMERFFDKLGKKYKTAAIRLFYACEANKSRGGYHVHFVLWIDVADKLAIRSFIKRHFEGTGGKASANTDVQEYDMMKGGIGYLLKQMAVNPDGYDFLTKNLPGIIGPTPTS